MMPKSLYIPCLTVIALMTTSCGFTHSKSDVARYLGKSEEQIVQILGTPTGWCGGPTDADDAGSIAPPRRIMYRTETATLPSPMTGLDFVLSDDGLCREVAGYTTGFSTPEELLKKVGVAGETLTRQNEDDTGIRFDVPELNTVMVYKPNRIPDQYSDFLVVG